MREEGAVGGSVAGSTAGWWPSDRDRFPPRFLLPPSLQTHNCIISTHLASSSRRPPSLTLSLSLSHPLFLSLPRSLSPSPYLYHSLPILLSSVRLLRLSPPPANSLLTSFSIRPGVRAFARPLLSRLLSFGWPADRPTGRSVDRPLLSLRRHPPRLLSSFARKRCHTRETAHRLFVLRCFPPPRRDAMRCDAMLSLAPFCHSRTQQRLPRS